MDDYTHTLTTPLHYHQPHNSGYRLNECHRNFNLQFSVLLNNVEHVPQKQHTLKNNWRAFKESNKEKNFKQKTGKVHLDGSSGWTRKTRPLCSN